jgi:hypothetical protein
MLPIRSNFVKFLILAFCCILPAWIVWVPDYETVNVLAFKWNYWFAAAIYAAFLIVSYRALRPVGWSGIKGWLRVNRIGILVSLLVALFFQVNEPHMAKVLCDEDVICGVAYQMHYERIAAFPTSMHNIEGKKAVTQYAVDKRPVGYPFLLSIVHDLTGFRYLNVFVLNGILGFVLLLLLYLFTKPVVGEKGAVAVLFLLSTFPLLAQNVTAAGFEVFNLCMIMAFALAARRYLSKAGSGGLDLFLAVSLVLAIARYESALYLAGLVGIVICKWARERKITMTPFSVVSPLFMLSAFISLRVFTGNSDFFQEEHGKFLSFAHLQFNLASAYRFMSALPSGRFANSLLLGVVGGVSIIAFVSCMFVKKTRNAIGDVSVVVLSLLAVASINTFIGLIENMGQWDFPGATRFSLPIHLVATVCFAAVLPVFLRGRQVTLALPSIFAAWMILVGAAQMARHDMTNKCPFGIEFQYFEDWAAKNATNRDLFVMDFPPSLIMQGHPCTSINAFNNHPWKFKNIIDDKIYDNVYICEILAINETSDVWSPYYACCPKGYVPAIKREILARTRIRPNVTVMISRVADIDDPEVEKHKKPTDPALQAKWYSESLP